MDYWKTGPEEPASELPDSKDPDDLFDDPAEVDPDNLSDDPETNAPLRSDRPDALPKDKRQQHISKEEELRLIALAQGDDPKEKQSAITALLGAHTGFLWQKVGTRKRYFSANITPEDLFHEAGMGLMHAIKKFDPGKGVKLTSYAGWWIDRAFSNYILKNATTQSVATRLDPVYRRILGAYQDYMKARRREKGDEPLSSAEKQEIRDLTGKWPHEIDEIRASVYGATYSLNTPIGDDKDGETFLDTLTKSPFTPPDALASDLSDRQFVEILIAEAGLTERERTILFARLGIGTDDEKPVTLEELGRQFDLSKERVRQITKKALEKLRRANSNGPRRNKAEIFPLETTTEEACASPPEHPVAPDSDTPAPSAEQNPPEEIATTTGNPKEEGDETDMDTKRIRTLAEAEKHQSELRPLPTTERDGYECLTARTLQTVHSMYQIVLEIQKTRKPIVFFDTQEKRIRGVFVLPEMADQLIAGTKKKNVSSINALRAGCYACIDSARKNGVLWLREGGGDQHVILAILPPTFDAIKLLNKLYGKNITPDMAQNQTQDTQTEPSPPAPDTGKTSPTIEPQASAPDLAPEPEETASGQMALPVPAPEDKEPEASPAFLMKIFQPETLLGDPDPIPTYDLPDPRDLIQTLRTLFAAVSDIMDHPQTPIRIEYPGNAVLVSADPNIIDYLSYQAESEGHNALKIEARDTAPRDREPIMLVTSFAGAAKGGVCIVPVDGTNIAFLPDDDRFESAQFMQAVLNHAFPQPQGAG